MSALTKNAGHDDDEGDDENSRVCIYC